MKQDILPFMREIERGSDFAPNYDHCLTAFDVKPSEWTHVCPCRFGDARVSHISKPSLNCPQGSVTKWSGDCYRYDIFKREVQFRGTQYALRWWNGGGEGWLLSMRHCPGEFDLLEAISKEPDEARRWDACHFIWQTAEKRALAGARSERKALFEAFAENRLHKRKVRGEDRVKVTISPKIVEQIAA